MRSPLGLVLAAAAAALGLRAAADSEREVRNVAIIGAGAAGASTAYHLRQYAQAAGLAVNVTIFERGGRAGGRSLTVGAYGDAAQPLELGASIFVSLNQILCNASRALGLTLAEAGAGAEPGDVTLVWDGADVVFRSVEGEAWWWLAGRLLWRYGAAPYRAVRLVRAVVANFLRLYDPPFFPFRSLTRRVYELGLHKVTGLTGEQFLAENKIDAGFARDVMQPATRVNYASNLAHIHGLEAMVSFATDGAVAVAGGNWQIFDRMVRSSGAALVRNTSVAAIEIDKGAMRPGARRRYRLSTRPATTDDDDDDDGQNLQQRRHPVAFDSVVVAAPWQFGGIRAGDGVLAQPIDEIPYMKLHVTLFASPHRLRPAYFGLEPGSRPPSNVYTTLGRGEAAGGAGPAGVGRAGFYSISTLRRAANPATGRREFLYKVFSAAALTPGFLSDVLGADVPGGFVSDEDEAGPISWYHPHWFHSYPVELPRVTFQDPVVGRGLYYTSGIEPFISTMETSALMGMNVARLVADALGGAAGPVGAAAPRGDFFDSVESEVGVNVMGQDEL